jgi:DNA-directed RNA polymerase sigma subunit (sigma70/sigma32)
MADLFSQIWHSTFRKAPTLSQEAALEVFSAMDAILKDALKAVIDSPSVLDDVMELTGIVLGSLSHGRGIYERGHVIAKDKSGEKEKKNTRGATWHADPGLTFRYRSKPDNDALTFIRATLRVYGAWQRQQVTADLVENIRLSRATCETVVENFLTRAEDYDLLSLKVARLRHEFEAEQDPKRAGQLALEFSKLTESMLKIEAALGMDHMNLYGTVLALRSCWERYRRLRETIYVPYLRIVFDEAKKRATSEIQTIENFQNGAIGLLSAISNYNSKRGVFSSYARQWAMQGILLRLKEEANPIKLPAAVWQTANQLNEIAQRLASKSPDGTYSMEEVAKEAGLDVRRAEKVLERIRSTQMLSIDFKGDDTDDGQSLHETVEAEPQDEIPAVAGYISRLDPAVKKNVLLHFGMFDDLPGSLPTNSVLVAIERLKQAIANQIQIQIRTAA